MFTFNIENWVPKFILADKYGFAVAMAIEAALRMFNEVVDKGVKCVSDYDTMPEWRLDELAWELNCLYDYSASVESKRDWIKNAIPYYRLYGTPKALYNYFKSVFDGVELDEAYQYGGEPFHFRVTVDGEYTPEGEAWALAAIAQAKNVRSVLDYFGPSGSATILVDAHERDYYYFRYRMAGTARKTGTIPHPATQASLSNTEIGVRASGENYLIQYEMAGTKPDTATLGALSDTDINVDTTGANGYNIRYRMCGNANRL